MGDIGATEILLIIIVLVLLFGARKLPDLARGTGRALRIFKSETKGLMTDEEDDLAERPAQAGPPQQALPPPAAPTTYDSTADVLPPTHVEKDR